MQTQVLTVDVPNAGSIAPSAQPSPTEPLLDGLSVKLEASEPTAVDPVPSDDSQRENTAAQSAHKDPRASPFGPVGQKKQVVHRVPQLASTADKKRPSPLLEIFSDDNPSEGVEMQFTEEGSVVQHYVSFLRVSKSIVDGPYYLRAGPFREIYHDPKQVKACIVACGGVCPGVNNVIREIVRCLFITYGVRNVFGIRYGYRGFYDPKSAVQRLDPEKIAQIHHDGGCFLGSSRGGFEASLIMKSIIERGFNQLYIIGGDGAQAAAQVLYNEITKRELKIAVAFIPRSVDNDITVIDRSFGFDTAVEEASRALNAAHVEAKCAVNGISIVRLPGRHAGFLVMYSALANRDVNICLIPEVKFRLDKLIPYVYDRVLGKGRLVIAVAEGAGQELMEQTKEVDASGNVKLADIAAFLKDQIEQHFKRKETECNVKLLNPTYMIRARPANAADSVFCSRLGQSAVHAAIAGYTCFSLGMVNQRMVMIPFEHILGSARRVDPSGHMWQTLVSATGQPSFL